MRLRRALAAAGRSPTALLGSLRRVPRTLFVVAGAASALLLGLGFLPQVGPPGYEAALAAGLVLPGSAALGVALEVRRARPKPAVALERGIAFGGVLGFAGLALQLGHGLRVGFCDPVEGLLLYALGGGFGALMGGAWGAVAGLFAELLCTCRGGSMGSGGAPPRGADGWRGTLVTVFAAILAPAAGIVLSLWRFYATPVVFALDPFFGYFSGPLYDTVVDGIGRLATYRFGSILSLLALAALLRHVDWVEDLEEPGTGSSTRVIGRNARRSQLRRVATGWAWPVLGVLGLVGSISLYLIGPSLGHHGTAASIRRALGQEMRFDRCTLVHAGSVGARESAAIGRECDAHVRGLERYFEVQAPARITVYLFESAAEKGRAMGAARTQIAKPWRDEIYLQYAPFPHPTLRHELAHVVAGAFGQGPFRWSGPAWGWAPDPGRIEGFATAAAPDEQDDITLEEGAKALYDLGLLPPLSRLFQLTFFAYQASTAYGVAGAFVSWLKEHYGAQTLRRWYGGGNLGELTGGKDLEALEREWVAHLRTVQTSARVLDAIRARAERATLFARSCPRVVDRLQDEANAHYAAGDIQGASLAFETALRLDPSHYHARLGLARCARRNGDLARAQTLYGELATDQHLAKVQQANARERIGDLYLAQAQLGQAAQAYREVAQTLVDSDRLRALDLKLAATRSSLGWRATVLLLAGDREGDAGWPRAAVALGEWAATDPRDGTADYLIGRNLYHQGFWQDAAHHLDRALSRELGIGRIRQECLSMRVTVACALDHPRGAESALKRWREERDVPAARRVALEDLAHRCGVRAPQPK